MSPRSPCAILTRPDGQAHALARALRAEGIDTLAFPLLHIAAQADPDTLAALDRALRSLASYALAVFVSPNAVTHGLARLALLERRHFRGNRSGRQGKGRSGFELRRRP
ncbi:MAG: uroporphyrinogen-III synthase, partial [Pandoraea sp.]|nr:uroporphyrinogen-III synthase [Pandoraea sp.]